MIDTKFLLPNIVNIILDENPGSKLLNCFFIEKYLLKTDFEQNVTFGYGL